MACLDHQAIEACAGAGGALCTLVGIEGSFSRRVGAQLAVLPDGRTVGSLSDGCLERQLAADAADARSRGEGPQVRRYGKGSPLVDFRLPCGSGLDILVDPAPAAPAVRDAVRALDARAAAVLELPLPDPSATVMLARRAYIPELRVLLFGGGPEFTALAQLGAALGTRVEAMPCAGRGQGGLALGQRPQAIAVDPWTAIVLLFHDHEWERELLSWAVTTPAFYIGAQGGGRARDQRRAMLAAQGLDEAGLARVRSPIGLIPRAREPNVLALSVLAALVEEYERLHPHA